MSTQLNPMAYAREAERLETLARRAWMEMDYRTANRLRRLALDMKRRATCH